MGEQAFLITYNLVENSLPCLRGSVAGDFDEEERGGLCPLREDQKVTIHCVGGYNRIRSVTGQPDLTRCTIIELSKRAAARLDTNVRLSERNHEHVLFG